MNDEYRYFFGPDRSKQIHPENYKKNVRLHHLHGSLSSFKDLSDGKLFKVTTGSLRFSDLYKKIFDLNVIPSIVTGGGKSLKVQQEPFNFYYNEFKKKMIVDEQMCEELYIIGYSFRDAHINKAIAERLAETRKKENPKPLKILIVDYASNEDAKKKFVDRVNIELKIPKKQAFSINDERILFGGANSISLLKV
nr:SIR2 family protein [Heyndrickxia sporothermodurans]